MNEIKYKKIYLEITNICNLSCDFCIKNCRKPKYMNKEEFITILKKIKNHTNYLYFHILGEPIMHPNINEYIDIAAQDFKINITTNGYQLDRVKANKNIRQINISLHSYDEKYKISLEQYMNNIFNTIDELKKTTYISLRFWLKNKYNTQIIDMINKHYKKNINLDSIKNNTTLVENIFLSVNKEFIWPDFKNDYYSDNGKCYALKDQIGILVDGTIVPCCLDSKGCINLGNIFNDELDNIAKTKRYQNMLEGFRNNKKVEELCKKCKFL